jgi:hypothetical protein
MTNRFPPIASQRELDWEFRPLWALWRSLCELVK